MTVLHHPSSDILLSYAAGRLDKGMSLVVDVHAVACAACRAEIEQLEAVGGTLLESLAPAEMAPDALDRALARIETRAPPPPPAARALPGLAGIDLSAALAGLDLGPRRWLAPGVWMRPIVSERGGRNTYLLRTGPGARLPRHGHTGEEFVCVLQGGFSDDAGSYGPGDFAQSGSSRVHEPATDADGECICLISSEGPMLMQGAVGKLLLPFFGL